MMVFLVEFLYPAGSERFASAEVFASREKAREAATERLKHEDEGYCAFIRTVDLATGRASPETEMVSR